MTDPAVRFQLQRTKGWRMPPNTRKVDRSTVFGNPFDVTRYGLPEAMRLHRAWLMGEISDEELQERFLAMVARHLVVRRLRVLERLAQLRGMNLACWCSPEKTRLKLLRDGSLAHALEGDGNVVINGIRTFLTLASELVQYAELIFLEAAPNWNFEWRRRIKEANKFWDCCQNGFLKAEPSGGRDLTAEVQRLSSLCRSIPSVPKPIATGSVRFRIPNRPEAFPKAGRNLAFKTLSQKLEIERPETRAS